MRDIMNLINESAATYADYARHSRLSPLRFFPTVIDWLQANEMESGMLKSFSKKAAAAARQRALNPEHEDVTAKLGRPEEFSHYWVWSGEVDGTPFFIKPMGLGSDSDVEIEVPDMTEPAAALRVAEHIFDLFGKR